MPGTDDHAADSPELLRRVDPAHGPLAAEPSVGLAAPSGVKRKVAAVVGCVPSAPPRELPAWGNQSIPQQEPVHRPLPSHRLLASGDPFHPEEEADFAAGEALLRLHAAELIDRLQGWSRDLDARQSQLNLQSAVQDQRERQFRLWTQDREAELQERLRMAEQRDKELRESAHRLALAELGNER